MKAKILISLAIIITRFSHAQCIAYTNLVAVSGQTATLTITNGQLAKVISAKFTGGYAQIGISTGGGGFSYSASDVGSTSNVAGTAGPPTVAGPATITLNPSSQTFSALCTVEIITPPAATGAFTPSTAVVIPADSGGPVTITLESSPDLINWTAALPGTYGTSTTNRFFQSHAATR